MVKVVVAIVLALAVFPWPWSGQTNAFAFTDKEGIAPEGIYSLLKREYLIWGSEQGQWQIFDSRAPVVANTLKKVWPQQQYWIAYIDSQTQSDQPAQARLQLKKGWNLVPGSAFLWASTRDKPVSSLTEQRFPEFGGLSVYEIVQEAWFGDFGERFSAPVSISSLDSQDFDRVRKALVPNIGNRGENIFYYVTFRHDTNPPRMDRRTITGLSIFYRKESLPFLWAIHQLAHELSHAIKEVQDWRYFGYDQEVKEAIADAGAAAVVRYLQEKRGMPEFSEPEERQELYGWARIIGTPEIRAEIAAGKPSSASLVKFFRGPY